MTDAELRARLSDRLHAAEERVRAACRRAGRDRSEVTLVAVTKTVSARVAGLLPELGVRYLGESRPQELWRKAEALQGLPVRWHMIGHLQRNKVERSLRLVQLVHSVDSLRLLQAIAAERPRLPAEPRVLLQINASREASKHGFTFEEVARLEPDFERLPVAICGLMTMAAFDADPERCRATFRELREFRDRLRGEWNRIGSHLQHLSMGMSNDFEVAIEEGATLVRLGSTLFEGIPAEEGA